MFPFETLINWLMISFVLSVLPAPLSPLETQYTVCVDIQQTCSMQQSNRVKSCHLKVLYQHSYDIGQISVLKLMPHAN